jgi:dipeptidyl aminopeptidase/acylaminoacyl peptidase
MKKNIGFIFGLCFLVLSSVYAQNGTEPIRTTDLLKLKTMTGIDISPDGDRAVFVLTSMEKDSEDTHRYFRHLWIIDLNETDKITQLTFGERSDASPSWSPDGSRIAFLRSFEGKPQVWILPMAGGEAFRVTGLENGASSFQWSPGGEKILCSSQIPEWAVEGTPAWPYERPGRARGDVPNWKVHKDKDAENQTTGDDGPGIKPDPDGSLKEIRAWLAKNASENNPRIFNRQNLQGENSLQTHLSYPHLFVVKAEPEADAQQITRGFQSFGGFDWSPDGEKIICTSIASSEHPDRVEDSDIWIMNADGTGLSLFLDWEGYRVSSPRYSPDGKTILFSARDQNEEGYALTKLAVISAQSGTPQPLTFDFDRSIYDYRWSMDGEYVYFISPDQGAYPLYRIPSAGGQAEPVIKGQSGVRDFDIGSGRLVYALTEVKNPFELYQAGLKGGDARMLTAFNAEWIKDKKIVFPKENWLENGQGFKIHYWVMEPAGRKPGEQYPLALEIHGGPSSMWGPGEFTMWHEFQLLAARGFGVVYCNPRGSGGYGFDFKKANYRDWGEGPASDILAAAAAAADLGWVDQERQVVAGGSYAGYMTAWLVSQDHRFKAAVAQRGVYELSVFFGEGRAWRLVPNHFGGYPWEAGPREFLDANSPQTFVQNIRTPLLIIHSDQDLRTGVIQSEYLYKSLKVLDKPVEYVRYPNEGHELSRSGNPNRRMDRLNRILEFFLRFI